MHSSKRQMKCAEKMCELGDISEGCPSTRRWSEGIRLLEPWEEPELYLPLYRGCPGVSGSAAAPDHLPLNRLGLILELPGFLHGDDCDTDERPPDIKGKSFDLENQALDFSRHLPVRGGHMTLWPVRVGEKCDVWKCTAIL
ncbi:Amyloid-Beta A4 Precursor Protein-Binding Family B Member 3 [Manis pentadactyla]|nr:Amyloid-Beta A4 Precursor Protein-Binding Family B Member 3 [Manis pentadactyla]